MAMKKRVPVNPKIFALGIHCPHTGKTLEMFAADTEQECFDLLQDFCSTYGYREELVMVDAHHNIESRTEFILWGLDLLPQRPGVRYKTAVVRFPVGYHLTTGDGGKNDV